MDLGLLQRDVAAVIGVSKAALLMWEEGRSRPAVHFWPAIVSFLGLPAVGAARVSSRAGSCVSTNSRLDPSSTGGGPRDDSARCRLMGVGRASSDSTVSKKTGRTPRTSIVRVKRTAAAALIHAEVPDGVLTRHSTLATGHGLVRGPEGNGPVRRAATRNGEQRRNDVATAVLMHAGPPDGVLTRHRKWNVAEGTVKKSAATRSLTWLSKNACQVWEGGPGRPPRSRRVDRAAS